MDDIEKPRKKSQIYLGQSGANRSRATFWCSVIALDRLQEREERGAIGIFERQAKDVARLAAQGVEHGV